MSTTTGIEWTDATWNPVVGCSIVSPGCTNCYAMKHAARLLDGNAKMPHYAGTTQHSKAGGIWTGTVALAPDHIITAPLRWRTPRRVFVNSMGDLFHESVPDKWINRVFAVMACAPQHAFQVLTKRSRRMMLWAKDASTEARVFQMSTLVAPDGRQRRSRAWPLPNVWLGVSTEDQPHAAERIPDLLATPAAVRFISAEPLLGPIDFTDIDVTMRWRSTAWLNALAGETWLPGNCGENSRTFDSNKLDWIIVGGESGHGARPCDTAWIESIVGQCNAARVPCFVKQLGGHVIRSGGIWHTADRKGANMSEWPDEIRVREFPQ